MSNYNCVHCGIVPHIFCLFVVVVFHLSRGTSKQDFNDIKKWSNETVGIQPDQQFQKPSFSNFKGEGRVIKSTIKDLFTGTVLVYYWGGGLSTNEDLFTGTSH